MSDQSIGPLSNDVRHLGFCGIESHWKWTVPLNDDVRAYRVSPFRAKPGHGLVALYPMEGGELLYPDDEPQQLLYPIEAVALALDLLAAVERFEVGDLEDE